MSSIVFNNNSSSPDPVGSGKSQLYSKSDGKIYKQQDGGAEAELATTVSGISGFGTSGGTFVVPPSVNRVTVKLWGGGHTGDNVVNVWEYDNMMHIGVDTSLNMRQTQFFQALDSPAATTDTKYGFFIKRHTYGGSYGGSVRGNYGSGASRITLMEIAQ